MDLKQLLFGMAAGDNKNKNPLMAGAAPGVAAAGQGPNVNPNMAPPENFWQGDTFKIGAPGMQAVPPGQAPPQQAQQQPQMPSQMGGGGFNASSYLQANPDIMQHYQNAMTPQQRQQYPTPEAFAQYHYNTIGKTEGRNMGGGVQGGQNPLMGGQQQQGPASPRIMARTPGNMNINPLIGGKY